jgi:hypothetical protein
MGASISKGSPLISLLLSKPHDELRIGLPWVKGHNFHMALHSARLAIGDARPCNDGISPAAIRLWRTSKKVALQKTVERNDAGVGIHFILF